MRESVVGLGAVIVTYESGDSGSFIAAADFVGSVVAPDAARRDGDGWDLVSLSVLPQRQGGTAGNMLFDTGGQFATQLAAVALYRQR